MNKALVIRQLKKTYNHELKALKSIDLEVEEGDFFALLGSNGAGKTTAIGIICGLINKTGGKVSIMGLDQDQEPCETKKMIGVMPQEFNFNLFESVYSILINQAGYYGISRKKAHPNIETLLKKMELWDKRSEPARLLSGGMKRRLMLVRALVHNPKILILDEPTAGVDVEIRRSMWSFLTELNAKGTTIILTTHYLEEAESLCRNIAILDEGIVIQQTSMKQLLSKFNQQMLILESEKILPEEVKSKNFSLTKRDETSLQITLSPDQNLTEALSELEKLGIQITYVSEAQNRLESLFLVLTHKE